MAVLRNIGAYLGLYGLLSGIANAHTWIEQYQVIGPNGSYIGDNGYSRGYVARTDPTFEGDANILWQLPQLSAREPNGDVRNRINSTDLLCHPNQRTSNYSNPEYPKLKVAPGNYVAMKYFENGHVTLPWNNVGKPDMGGTVFVFGTTKPTEDETIANVMKWTSDGKGGDGRGFLMTAQNYDDGRCHQINDCVMSAERQFMYPNHVTNTNTSAELWCETDLHIPITQQPGSTLTTYWIWQWSTEPGMSCTYPTGKDEYYTTCADFDIIASSGTDDAVIAAEPEVHTLLQPDFQTAAVSSFASRTALTTSPSVILNDWSTFSAQLTASPTSPLPASFVASCSAAAQQAAAAASAGQIPGPPPSCPAGKWATGEALAAISASVAKFASASAAPVPTVASTTAAPVTDGPASTTPAAAGGIVSSSAAAPVTAISTAPVARATTLVSVSTVTEIQTVSVPVFEASSTTTAAPVVGTDGVVIDAVAASMSEHCATMRKHARQFR